MDLKEITRNVEMVAREAAQFIRGERERFSMDKVELKGFNNFVSFVDTMAEKLLTGRLSAILPSAGFIAEEGTVGLSDRLLKWVIDPLDGTTNFIHGLSPYAVSIALMEGDTLLSGVIHEVSLDESFSAWRGGGAWLNGQPIQVSGAPALSGSLIATGFPYYNYDRITPFLGTLDYFMRHTHGVRRLGSAATDLAYVACGRFDAFYEYSLSPWDVAAGAIIVGEAGGRVSDFSGGTDFVFGKEIVASNPLVYNEFLQIIQREF
jgi:myo-inositol-1(or 4)-monophosphatase